jgi:hypothetical protein
MVGTVWQAQDRYAVPYGAVPGSLGGSDGEEEGGLGGREVAGQGRPGGGPRASLVLDSTTRLLLDRVRVMYMRNMGGVCGWGSGVGGACVCVCVGDAPPHTPPTSSLPLGVP